MKRDKKNYVAPVLAVLALAAVPAAPGRAQGINVSVNGDFIAFPGQPPVQRFGTVLVPLRGVFEKLGASVQYEPATKTILAVKGPTTVSLRLGEARAIVNGSERTLSVPAQATGGTTLVPLRFVSEALGAQVKWEAPTRTVRISTDAQVAGELPPAPGGTGPITGTITGIYPESSALSLRVTGGENTRIPLSPDAIVLVKGTSGPTTQTNLSALRTGDQITVRRDREGRATVLEATYGERTGEVKTIQRLPSGNYIVTLSNGSVVEVLPSAPVTMSGRSVQITDIQPGERVAIRVNPQTQQGIGLAVVTGDNPAPTPPARVEVTSFTLAGDRPLRAGEPLTATLKGTPGASATFTIPGVEAAQDVPMRETAPGTYTGSFTVPAGVNVKGASVLASLKKGNATSPVIQAGSPITIDAAGPTLADLSPAENASLPPGKPLIYGTYSDAGGTGVDPAATRLIVNNKDVTGQATVTPAFFSFRPSADLPEGQNRAVVIARDAAGNETRKEWTFTIAAGQSLVKNMTFSPEGKTLQGGDVLTVRAEGAPNGTARFSIGGAITDRPMREESPGVYVGTYTVKKGDSLAKAPVVVSFNAPGGAAITQTASQSVTISSGAPDAPVIDAPQEGASVGGSVTLSGRAAPGATVRYSLRYQGRLLILPAGGNVADGEVKANAQGRWSVADIRLGAPFGVSDITYTLQAVTVDAAGDTSEAATVQFKK